MLASRKSLAAVALVLSMRPALADDTSEGAASLLAGLAMWHTGNGIRSGEADLMLGYGSIAGSSGFEMLLGGRLTFFSRCQRADEWSCRGAELLVRSGSGMLSSGVDQFNVSGAGAYWLGLVAPALELNYDSLKYRNADTDQTTSYRTSTPGLGLLFRSTHRKDHHLGGDIFYRVVGSSQATDISAQLDASIGWLGLYVRAQHSPDMANDPYRLSKKWAWGLTFGAGGALAF